MSREIEFVCPDCEQLTATVSGNLCTSCARWRESKFSAMEAEWQEKMVQRKRFRALGAMSGANFGEALADMAKAVERSRK